MTCLAEMCDAEVTGQEYNVMGSYWGYCGLVKARHLDGLAFGVHWSIPFTSGSTFGPYCAGWRNDEPGNRVGNSMVCGTDTDVVKTYRFFEGY